MDYKRFCFFIFFIGCTSLAFCQTSLESFNEKRLSINETGMMVLGSWALVNLVSSPVLARRSEGSTRYFYQMNGYWNAVNLAIAGFGFYSALNGETSGLALSETLSEQFSMEKILLFNAGLDLAYMAGGFYLKERAKNSMSNQHRFEGFGNSLILQGGFLLAFDLGMYFIHHNHASELLQHIDQLTLNPFGFSLSWKI